LARRPDRGSASAWVGSGAAAGGEQKAESRTGTRLPNPGFYPGRPTKAQFAITPMAAHKKMLREMKMKVEPDPRPRTILP